MGTVAGLTPMNSSIKKLNAFYWKTNRSKKNFLTKFLTVTLYLNPNLEIYLVLQV